MSNNLDEKIRLLIIDMERYTREDKAWILKRFLEQELGLQQAPCQITAYDVSTIHSNACHLAANMPTNAIFDGRKIGSDRGLLQTICYLEAIYTYFRMKNWTHHNLVIQTKRSTD